MQRKEFSRIVDIFGIKGELGNKIHTKLVYTASKNQQTKHLKKIENIIKYYDYKKLEELAFNKKTRILIKSLIKIKNKENNNLWTRIVKKFLKGITYLLKREISRGQKVELDKEEIIKEIKKLEIYNKNDIIKIKNRNNELLVNYISLPLSPRYNKKFESWRDTQFKFIIYLDKGLFVWTYININEAYRNKGLGTKLIKTIEKVVSKQGVHRFSVEYPNRSYWRKKAGYIIPNKLCLGKIGYSIEGYKEF